MYVYIPLFLSPGFFVCLLYPLITLGCILLTCLTPSPPPIQESELPEFRKKCHLFLSVPRTQHRAWLVHGNSVILELINKQERMSKRRQGQNEEVNFISHSLERSVIK